MGANIGFNKLQMSYTHFFSPQLLTNTTFAARVILGVANVFSSREGFEDINIPELRASCLSASDSLRAVRNTLRGFDFESAGPRVVIVPTGVFRKSNGDPVFLDPFTVPLGGNALAVVNLEARYPITKSLRGVGFYDGGNVFFQAGDLFNPPEAAPNDVVRHNLRALWTHTIGVGLRLKTPFGGEFGVDYGYLLNPPTFLIPQMNGQMRIIDSAKARSTSGFRTHSDFQQVNLQCRA
jgi:outer membrane protein assembly factor BamA